MSLITVYVISDVSNTSQIHATFLLIFMIKSLSYKKLMGHNTKNGWAKKFAGPMNWVGQTLKWVGQCQASPPVYSAATGSRAHYPCLARWAPMC